MNRKVLALLVVFPTLAHANPIAGSIGGLTGGLVHPIHGLDHLLAMLAVGLWAVQLGGKATWAVPASFLGVMALGGLAGLAGWTLPMAEAGILASVFLLGLLIAFAVRLPGWAGALLVGGFALFHGHSHGTEIPAHAQAWLYAGGFVLTTAALHLAGMGLGLALKNGAPSPALRAAGAMVLAGGVVLAFGS